MKIYVYIIDAEERGYHTYSTPAYTLEEAETKVKAIAGELKFHLADVVGESYGVRITPIDVPIKDDNNHRTRLSPEVKAMAVAFVSGLDKNYIARKRDCEVRDLYWFVEHPRTEGEYTSSHLSIKIGNYGKPSEFFCFSLPHPQGHDFKISVKGEMVEAWKEGFCESEPDILMWNVTITD